METLSYNVSDPDVIVKPSKVATVITDESGEAPRTERIPLGESKVKVVHAGDRLRVYKEDLDVFLPALEWATGQQMDIPMPPRSDREGFPIDHPGRVYEWRIGGNFTPVLDERKIHAVIGEWKLLKGFFRMRKDAENPEKSLKFMTFFQFDYLLPLSLKISGGSPEGPSEEAVAIVRKVLEIRKGK